MSCKSFDRGARGITKTTETACSYGTTFASTRIRTRRDAVEALCRRVFADRAIRRDIGRTDDTSVRSKPSRGRRARDLFPWCESTNERASERGRFYEIPSRDPSLFLSTKFNICCIPNELLRARALDRRRRHISPHSEMTHGSLGLFPPPVATFSTFRTTNIPSPKTLPNTTCLSSNHSVLAHVMKN